MPGTDRDDRLEEINARLKKLEDRTDALKLLVTIGALAAAAWLMIWFVLNYGAVAVIPAG